MPGGAPTLLTPERHAKIVAALRAGCYIHQAAAYAGVSERSVYEWVKRGTEAEGRGDSTDDPDWEFSQFSQAVRQARGDASVEAVGIVRSVMGMREAEPALALRAATWYLERSDPEHWGRTTRLGMTGDDDSGDLEGEQLLNRGDALLDEIAAKREANQARQAATG